MAKTSLPKNFNQNKIGDVFTRLTIIAHGEPYGPRRKKRWICRCECGKEILTYASALRQGQMLSCGCLGQERRVAAVTKHGQSAVTRRTGAYSSWQAMKQRCLNPKHKHYPSYGGRGIVICERWINSFVNFYEDMGDRPDGHTIHRVNNDGNYEPSNCQWLSHKDQQRHRNDNITYELNGETKCLSEWCEIYDVPFARVITRLNLGWKLLDALTAPPNKKALRSTRERDVANTRGKHLNVENWSKGKIHKRTLRRHEKQGKS